MIDLDTLAGLHAHDHELHAYCATCARWSVLPLAQMIAAGMGQRRLPLRVRCLLCEAVGQLQIRPPMPARSSTGWIAPPVR
jgi:hypothetical protein